MNFSDDLNRNAAYVFYHSHSATSSLNNTLISLIWQLASKQKTRMYRQNYYNQGWQIS